MEKNKNAKIFFLALVAGWLFLSGSAAAQEENAPVTIQVSPVRYDWELKPGDETGGVINLKNYTDKPYEVETQIEDFYVADDSYRPQFFVPDASHPLVAYDVINWISMPEKNWTIGPGESKNVLFSVKVPEKTPTGGYYGAIFFQYKEKPESELGELPEGAARIKVNTRLGVLLTMAVRGEQKIIRNGKLDSFSTSRKIYFTSPVELEATASNSGNLHFKASGKFDIFKGGNLKKSIEIVPRILYPDRIRTYEDKWEFTYLDMGKYRAAVSLISDDGEIRLAGETSFWVIPWQSIATALALIIFIWSVYKLGQKRGGKKKDKE